MIGLPLKGCLHVTRGNPAVDALRVGLLLERARRTGDPELAISCYDEALGRWRGDALADFAGERWALADAARWGELRLVAIAERAERMLTLGRYEQLVADLKPVVTRFPARERLVGQLMVALFNAGRQVEALEVFAQTRRVLADDFGLDPSRELRGMMEQIVRQDTAIGPAGVRHPLSHRPGADEDDVIPLGNLPLRTTSFVGREQGRRGGE